ncbi:unnamed protein product [Meloidogyne enterolobii]|uniref:Uncharacterized protein n=1 Tax=Meloidogyne enterolobii TaxID=390850 RepID=A0ACB0Y3W4_MELEN
MFSLKLIFTFSTSSLSNPCRKLPLLYPLSIFYSFPSFSGLTLNFVLLKDCLFRMTIGSTISKNKKINTQLIIAVIRVYEN